MTQRLRQIERTFFDSAVGMSGRSRNLSRAHPFARDEEAQPKEMKACEYRPGLGNLTKCVKHRYSLVVIFVRSRAHIAELLGIIVLCATVNAVASLSTQSCSEAEE